VMLDRNAIDAPSGENDGCALNPMPAIRATLSAIGSVSALASDALASEAAMSGTQMVRFMRALSCEAVRQSSAPARRSLVQRSEAALQHVGEPLGQRRRNLDQLVQGPGVAADRANRGVGAHGIADRIGDALGRNALLEPL